MCCCEVCGEWARLRAVRDERGRDLRRAIDANDLGALEEAIRGFIKANRQVGDFELANYSVLAEHQFVGVSVTNQGIVVREPPLPGTSFNHDWCQSKLGDEPLHIRTCRNCGVTYLKVGGDPISNEGWVKYMEGL